MPAANAQVGTGTMNVHLTIPAGETLTQTFVQTFNSAIGFDDTTGFVAVNLTCKPRAALAAPALGRLTPLLGLSLAALGALALRRRVRSD